MNETYCMCLLKSFVDKNISVLPTACEFLVSSTIVACGIFLNYNFLKKLNLERRNKPLGRKGNVIEPIMRWFCVVQILYWPYYLLMFWSFYNNIMFEGISFPSWICQPYVASILLGRTIIAYNSLFVALIRYVYIVHERKANQWDFEKVGRRFQIASIAAPALGVFLAGFTLDMRSALWHWNYSTNANRSQCAMIAPVLISFTLEFIPKLLADALGTASLAIIIIIYLNLAEGYLYLRIFQRVKR